MHASAHSYSSSGFVSCRLMWQRGRLGSDVRPSGPLGLVQSEWRKWVIRSTFFSSWGAKLSLIAYSTACNRHWCRFFIQFMFFTQVQMVRGNVPSAVKVGSHLQCEGLVLDRIFSLDSLEAVFHGGDRGHQGGDCEVVIINTVLNKELILQRPKPWQWNRVRQH